MIKILKASAGSGKTYNLAKEYIRLILQSDKTDAYRHVLAVTFTNKATDEMKRRILQELYVLSRNPDDSPYVRDLVPAVLPDTSTLQKRARQQLTAILHDYSAFAVSTIDRFFQQTLRAFSREIGQFSTYQVQLDREALVQESVDRVLDNLSEQDRTLLEWLTRSVQEDLEQRGRFSLEDRLKDVAGSLQSLPEGEGNFPREKLEALRTTCRELISTFRKQLAEAARACLKVLDEAGVPAKESNRGFLKHLYDYLDEKAPIKKPKDSFLTNAANPELWFAKSKRDLFQRVEGVLDGPLQAFTACFGQAYRVYVTAQTLLAQLYGLGVINELREAWTDIQKEKNMLSIDDSNTILRNIIDGTDTPFIYEKLGVRFEDFLLDEFQDTADIQWENFRPLLHNSDSSGFDSLVVGDVKQSIYRWRGGDWTLLGSRLEQEFEQVQTARLDRNFRTCKAIVTFNNAFFTYAAEQLGLQDLYADVEQQPCFRDPAPGSVEVRFTEDQMQEVLQTLRDVKERGGEWEDIAILVRDRAEGADVAALLVENGIPVVSDDSLYVKSSVTVRRLVSQLSLLDVPVDTERPTVAGYLARSMDVQIPEHYHSLPDLAEGLLRDLKASAPETFAAEIPYIQSFMDYLQDWTVTGGNNLNAFLRAWEDAKPKIASPQSGHSVRVMTIHKSKGLEFPFVLVPFAEKVTLYKASAHWCKPAVEGTPLSQDADGMYRVQLDENAADSLFGADYERERRLEAIDNINVFYVALTRAKYGLKIIASPPPQKLESWKNMSQLLYSFVGSSEFTAGEPYPLGSLKRGKKGANQLSMDYESYPANSGKRLKVSPEAADYFGADGSTGMEASRRIRGNVLHGILSRIDTAEDLPAAVAAAVQDGGLPAREQESTLAFLQERLQSVADKGWFAPGNCVWKEAAVIGPDGNEYRPDRVVRREDGSVEVIDYKFGVQKDSYVRQVRRYMHLYKKMGYEKVAGYLWYLDDNFTIFVAG
ncbi:MAG: UvrD-helicase domain-containing protein [Bacteroidales bacterium]|nr:UvrD-helicase domain-containing protein [Bacteroidales bacterium]